MVSDKKTAALEVLQDRHLLICGGTRDERLDLARDVVESARNNKTEFYELPFGISSDEDYLYVVQEVFPIFSPVEYFGWLRKILPFLPVFRMPKRCMNLDQVWDMHLDWVELRERTLVFWPEAEMGDNEGFPYILSDYVDRKHMIEDPDFRQRPEDYRPPWFRLVVTTARIQEDLYEAMVPQTEPYTAREHLGVISLTGGS